MLLSQFRHHLVTHPNHELRFILPDDLPIPSHFHVTEAGRTDRTFIDCGGTMRHVSHCTLQAWVADDYEHRLMPASLVEILDKLIPLLRGDDLDVEIEFEDGVLSQFPVLGVCPSADALSFTLGLKHTDCLAKDVCLPASTTKKGCCPGSGCC